jgi:hypothetical protein
MANYVLLLEESGDRVFKLGVAGIDTDNQDEGGYEPDAIALGVSGVDLYDDFQRAAGNDIGNGWTEDEEAATDLVLYDVAGGAIAVLHASQGETDYFRRATPACGSEFVVQVTVNLSANASSGVWVGDTTPGTDGYAIIVNHSTQKIEIWKDGAAMLTDVIFTVGTSDWVILRVHVIDSGTSVRFIVYAAIGTGQNDITTDVVQKIDYTDSTSPHTISIYGASLGWWGAYEDNYFLFSDESIVITGMEIGWKIQIDSRTAVVATGSTITIDASTYGQGTTVKLLDPDDTLIDSVSPGAGVNPGDTYSVTGQTLQYNYTATLETENVSPPAGQGLSQSAEYIFRHVTLRGRITGQGTFVMKVFVDNVQTKIRSGGAWVDQAISFTYNATEEDQEELFEAAVRGVGSHVRVELTVVSNTISGLFLPEDLEVHYDVTSPATTQTSIETQ